MLQRGVNQSIKRSRLNQRASLALAVGLLGASCNVYADNASELVRTPSPGVGAFTGKTGYPFLDRSAAASQTPSAELASRLTAPSQPAAENNNSIYSVHRVSGPGRVQFNTARVRSVAVPIQRTASPGRIQTNPLVVNEPPELRRFDASQPMVASDVPWSMQSETQSDTALRVAEKPALDDQSVPAAELAVKEKPATAPEPAVAKSPTVVQQDAFDEAIDSFVLPEDFPPPPAQPTFGSGMLAIDQIGDHLPKSQPSHQTKAALTGQRFPNDHVAVKDRPSAKSEAVAAVPASQPSTLRDHLSMLDTDEFKDANLPALPSPDATNASESQKPVLTAKVPDNSRVFDPLPSPYGSLPDDAPKPREVDEILNSAATGDPIDTDVKQLELKDQPTFSKRFSDWKNRFRSNEKPETPAAQPSKVSQPSRGGFLQRWFRK